MPPEQLTIGEALLKAMYNKGADLPKLSQQQQLQVLQLADAYSVLPVSTAVCNSLSSLPMKDLAWDTVTATFTLPYSCKQLPCYNQLLKAAAEKLQLALGDLEILWAGESTELLQKQLLQLPFLALKQLISDPRTRVASEDTIFFTMDCWLASNLGSTTQEQKKELAQLLQLCHCTPSYLTSCMATQGSWLLECLDPSVLCRAAAVAGAVAWGADSLDWKSIRQLVGSSVMAARRLSSAMDVLTVPLVVPLTKLEEMHQAATHADCSAGVSLRSKACRWQGRELHMVLRLKYSHEEQRGTLSCNAVWEASSSSTVDAAACTWLKGTLQIDGDAFGGHVPYMRVFGGDGDTATVQLGGDGYNVVPNLGLGPVSYRWQEIDDLLRESVYVQDDECIHLTLSITEFR